MHEDLPSELQMLVDRLAISDLLVDFARCLDARDWSGYAANFTEDGVLAVPSRPEARGRDQIAARPAEDLSRYAATQHHSTNHVIEVRGDTATARAYTIAVHVRDAGDPARHTDVGVRYACDLRRTPEGWRFSRVELHRLWLAGEPLARG